MKNVFFDGDFDNDEAIDDFIDELRSASSGEISIGSDCDKLLLNLQLAVAKIIANEVLNGTENMESSLETDEILEKHCNYWTDNIKQFAKAMIGKVSVSHNYTIQ